MAETSAIEWTDATFNPWIGCTKISPACDHCYAEALMDQRHGRVKWGGERSRTSAANWQQPRRWQKQAPDFFAKHGRRRRVFCASLADVFDNQVPDDWRADLWALIRDCPDLDWLLLTKRPQNIGKMLPLFWDEVKGHVWLGTTVEDQQRADQNIPHLLQHDAAVRFVSIEPMLGPIQLDDICDGWKFIDALRGNWWHDAPGGQGAIARGQAKLDWVIAGGESGHQARPSHPDWFRSLRDQCTAADVPFLFKQWGEWAPSSLGGDIGAWSSEERRLNHNGEWTGQMSPDQCSWPDTMNRVGKKRAGRLLDGVEHNGFPEVQHD